MQVNIPTTSQPSYKKFFLLGLGIFVVLVIGANIVINQYGLFWKQDTNTHGKIGIEVITPICPTTKSFCNESNVITNTEFNVHGIGGILPNGSTIVAAFDGEILAVTSVLPEAQDNERIATIYLDNKDKQLRAVYYYKGDLPTTKTAKKGEVIAKTGETMQFFKASLIFELIEGDPLSGKLVNITKETFE